MPGHPVLRRLIALRAQLGAAIVVLLLLTLPGDLGVQVVDVILRWNEDWWIALLTLALVVVTTAVTALTGRRALRWASTQPAVTGMDRWVWWTCLGVGVAVLGLGIVCRDVWVGPILLPIGIFLVVFWLIALPEAVRTTTRAA